MFHRHNHKHHGDGRDRGEARREAWDEERGRHEGRFARHPRGEDGLRHGWHHAGGGGRGGRGGLGRFFAHGDLRLVILQLIAETPRHGYEIIKAIEQAAGGAYSPSPGVIYPTLTLLEELGYVTVSTSGDGARKLHSITPQGLAFLDANRPTLEALRARMAEASRAQGGGPAPQILRAMENLKLALRQRLAAGPLTPEQADAVAAALDTAAVAVERVR